MGLTLENLGIQAHCLRRALSASFEDTLHRVRALGLRSIELCSFPGCAGNPWGDFGDLADKPTEAIAAALDDAGLACVATHVMQHELAPDRIDATIGWAQGVGAPVVVLAGVRDMAGADLNAWRRTIDSLNELGARLAGHGLGFCYHTQNDVWRPVARKLPAAELLERLDPAHCAIELDPSGALVTGADWKSLVREHPGRFFSMHLRDGIRPGREVPYLPAVPLGAGDEDWPSAFETAELAGIPRYLLEMEVAADHDVFEALRASLAYLETLGVPEARGLRNAS